MNLFAELELELVCGAPHLTSVLNLLIISQIFSAYIYTFHISRDGIFISRSFVSILGRFDKNFLIHDKIDSPKDSHLQFLDIFIYILFQFVVVTFFVPIDMEAKKKIPLPKLKLFVSAL